MARHRPKANSYCYRSPLPEEIEDWQGSRVDSLSFDDLWDMFVERGMPVIKGLHVTGIEHLCFLPMVDTVWGSIGSTSCRCVRDTTAAQALRHMR